MTVWFTSDHHFNHANIIKFTDRPFSTVEEMNEAMIANWNTVVRADDEVWVVGDFCYTVNGLPSAASHFYRLNGNKHLVIGNHDEKNKEVLQLRWASQHHIAKVKTEGKKFVLCHYPMETWEGAHRGTLMVHGHSHGGLRRKIAHRYDVGVDVVQPWGFRFLPVAAAQLAEVSEKEEYDPVDHHGA